MDLSKFVEDNLDNLIDDLADKEDNIDNKEEELIEYEEYNEELKEKNKIENQKILDEKYYALLLNKFMEYYNKRYEDNKNLYSGIKDENDTNLQMEIFYKAIYRLNDFSELSGILNNYECMECIYEVEDFILIENFEDKYVLEYGENKKYCQCLLIVLNYIIMNNIKDWIIFDLTEE
jgi:hypothetical protein